MTSGARDLAVAMERLKTVLDHPGSPVARPEVRVEDPGMFPDNGLRYRAHFTTCPNADEWRNR